MLFKPDFREILLSWKLKFFLIPEVSEKGSILLKSQDHQKALNVQLYIINFTFLAQFGGELYEEQTKKSRNLQKAYLGTLLNIHT